MVRDHSAFLPDNATARGEPLSDFAAQSAENACERSTRA